MGNNKHRVEYKLQKKIEIGGANGEKVETETIYLFAPSSKQRKSARTLNWFIKQASQNMAIKHTQLLSRVEADDNLSEMVAEDRAKKTKEKKEQKEKEFFTHEDGIGFLDIILSGIENESDLDKCDKYFADLLLTGCGKCEGKNLTEYIINDKLSFDDFQGLFGVFIESFLA